MGPTEAGQQAHALLEDLRQHDLATRGHSERVRAYADLIAEALGLPEAEQEKLRLAALLHDVGKLEVSRGILAKPDEPTEAEWEELRGHPAAAVRILAPILPWLGDWVGAATEHHERFNGSGYPRGLARHRISLAGRIVAVADAYDTMVAGRAYQRAVSADRARTELSDASGTHFDPEIVRALLAVQVSRLHPSQS